jgi:ERCC4-type nuclease
MSIIVDDREPKSVQNALRKYFPDLIVRRLDYGDVIDTDKNACVERKKDLDLSSSIDDGRLLNQAEGMKENFEHAIIIKVGNYENVRRNRYHKRMTIHRFIGGETDSLCYYGIPIVQCENESQFSRYVDSFFRKIGGKRPQKAIKRKNKKKNDDKISCLLGIHMLGEKRARALLKQFTFGELCKATEKDLMTVVGIGRKHANIIKQVFN